MGGKTVSFLKLRSLAKYDVVKLLDKLAEGKSLAKYDLVKLLDKLAEGKSNTLVELQSVV